MVKFLKQCSSLIGPALSTGAANCATPVTLLAGNGDIGSCESQPPTAVFYEGTDLTKHSVGTLIQGRPKKSPTKFLDGTVAISSLILNGSLRAMTKLVEEAPRNEKGVLLILKKLNSTEELLKLYSERSLLILCTTTLSGW